MSTNQESIEEIIAGIDLTRITAAEIVNDVMNKSNEFAFRMMVASALLERVQGKPAQQDENQQPVQEGA